MQVFKISLLTEVATLINGIKCLILRKGRTRTKSSRPKIRISAEVYFTSAEIEIDTGRDENNFWRKSHPNILLIKLCVKVLAFYVATLLTETM